MYLFNWFNPYVSQEYTFILEVVEGYKYVKYLEIR